MVWKGKAKIFLFSFKKCFFIFSCPQFLAHLIWYERWMNVVIIYLNFISYINHFPAVFPIFNIFDFFPLKKKSRNVSTSNGLSIRMKNIKKMWKFHRSRMYKDVKILFADWISTRTWFPPGRILSSHLRCRHSKGPACHMSWTQVMRLSWLLMSVSVRRIFLLWIFQHHPFISFQFASEEFHIYWCSSALLSALGLGVALNVTSHGT